MTGWTWISTNPHIFSAIHVINTEHQTGKAKKLNAYNSKLQNLLVNVRTCTFRCLFFKSCTEDVLSQTNLWNLINFTEKADSVLICSLYTSPSLHDHWIAMNTLQAIKSFYRQICFHQNQDSPFWGLHRAKQHLNWFMRTLKLTSNSCYIAAAATQGMLSCFPLQGVSAGKAWAERDFLFKSKWRYKSGTATVMRSSHTSLGLLRN